LAYEESGGTTAWNTGAQLPGIRATGKRIETEERPRPRRRSQRHRAGVGGVSEPSLNFKSDGNPEPSRPPKRDNDRESKHGPSLQTRAYTGPRRLRWRCGTGSCRPKPASGTARDSSRGGRPHGRRCRGLESEGRIRKPRVLGNSAENAEQGLQATSFQKSSLQSPRLQRLYTPKKTSTPNSS